MNKDNCVYCGKRICSTYFSDWNGNKVCEEHYKYIHHCSCCFGFVGQTGREIENGRHICEKCLSHEVSYCNLLEHVNYVYKALYDKGFNDIQRDHINIELVSKSKMGELYPDSEASGLHSGYSQVWNEKGRTGFKQDIYVLDHQHHIIFEGILAHELIHGWQLQQNITDWNKYDEIEGKTRTEGFAQLGCYIIMKRRFEEAKLQFESTSNTKEKEKSLEIMRLCKFKLKSERDREDPMYGVAFKKLLVRKNLVGWHQLIREARLDQLKLYV